MAQRESGYERQARDAYMTPRWVTGTLTDEIVGRILPRGATVWEPAAGTGQMVEALEASGLDVVPSDIHAPTDGGDLFGGNRAIVADFLDEMQPVLPFRFDAIITNPPYKLADEFVRRALELTRLDGGLVAMLLGAKFDCGKTRADIFGDCPAWGLKISLVDRIWWFDPQPGDKGPSEDHAWFVWDWRGRLGRTMSYASAPAAVLEEIRRAKSKPRRA